MRQSLLDLSAKEFDVLIIGAGINGAGVAQQLSAAGYSTLLVDKHDFGAATTSGSSRLLHCGMAYLARLRNFADGGYLSYPSRAVGAIEASRRAMRSRSAFVRSSPERLRKLKLYYTVHDDHPHKPWQLDIAFRILRHFESTDVPLGYRRLNRRDIKNSPLLGLVRDNISAAFEIAEYQFNWPERICVDAALDAESNGAVVRNYTKVESLKLEEAGWTASLMDVRNAGKPITVKARIVVNASGPWVNDVNALTAKTVLPKVQAVKGVHVYLKLSGESESEGLVTFTKTGKSVYCIPWKDAHYFGYIEHPLSSTPDDVAPTNDEVDELVEEAKQIFPRVGISRDSIITSWAGARPATFDETLAAGRAEMRIHDMSSEGLTGMFAITAGNIMTHRQTAEVVRAKIERLLQPSRVAKTLSYRPRDAKYGSPRSKAEQWIECARTEHVVTLADLLFRRVGSAWSANLGQDVVRDAADSIATEMGWSKNEVEKHLAEYRMYLEKRFT